MRMIKITIRNHTAWQTKMLRPFIARIAREEFPGTKPSNTRTRLTVVVKYHRGGDMGTTYCSGHAYYNSSSSQINVPHPKHGGAFPVKDFCHVVGHEFGHCRGLKHSEMGWQHGNSCNRGGYSWPHYEGWASKLPLPLPVMKKTVDHADRRAAKLQRAYAALETWQRKHKLATTKLQTWKRRIAALERAQAKAACAPVTSGESEG
jgi:hypothetical protein